MGAKKRRQTFAKLKREQAVKERRDQKQARKREGQLAKAANASGFESIASERAEHAPAD
jgi:hypothetical protein